MLPANSSATGMRAIILAAGSDGDIHPHLGLASALAARGHEVLFLTSFDYLDLVRSCGFDAASIIDPHDQDDFQSVEGLGPIGKARSRCRFFARKVAAICASVSARLDDRSILIAPPFAWPLAKLLHLTCGVPYISTVLSPPSLCSLRNPPAFRSGEWFSRLPWPARKALFRGLEYFLVDPVFRWLLKDLLRTMQLPAPRRVISQWSHSPQRMLGLFSDWFCPKAEDWPPQLMLTSFPLFHPHAATEELSASLRRFLDAGAPPVVFTAGTETRTVRSFFEIALRGVQTLGLRAVFLTRLAGQLPSLPDTIHYENYSSLHLLLPRAAAIVHHGGIGTTAQAFHAGIPQLLLPGRLDQFDNARHVERLGCGLVEKNLRDSRGATARLRSLLHSVDIADTSRALRHHMVPGHEACSRAAELIEETWHGARTDQGTGSQDLRLSRGLGMAGGTARPRQSCPPVP